jgi:hypothetical protein
MSPLGTIRRLRMNKYNVRTGNGEQALFEIAQRYRRELIAEAKRLGITLEPQPLNEGELAHLTGDGVTLVIAQKRATEGLATASEVTASDKATEMAVYAATNRIVRCFAEALAKWTKDTSESWAKN